MGSMTNPLLDEINGLSPGAKQALMQAHQTAQPLNMAAPTIPKSTPDAAPPAMMAPPSQQPAVPSMGMLGPAPAPATVTPGPRGTSAGDQAEVQRLRSTDAGVDQIKNPFLHGLAKTADTIGSLVAPGLTQRIPGTTLHHNLLGQAAEKQLGTDIGNEEKQAQTSELGARTALTNAQASALPAEQEEKNKLTDAQIANFLHPQAKTAFEAWRQQNPDAPVEKFFQAEQDVKPQKVDTPEQQYIDDFQKQHPGSSIADAVKAYATDSQHPQRISINAGQNEADKIATRLGKPYETMNTAATAQLDKIDEAMSMIHGNAEAQALGIPKTMTALVSGQGSGVRITQAELNMIARARGIQGDFEGYVNKLSGKGTLTKTQQDQISGVLQDAKQRILLKQQIANQTLDTINGATSREQIVQADTQARKLFGQLEKYGRYEGERLPDGRVIQKIYEQDGKVKVDVAAGQ